MAKANTTAKGAKSRTNAKGKAKEKEKKPVESNFWCELDDDGIFTLDVYVKDDGENANIKITCAEKFVCYGRLAFAEDEDGEEYCFASLPSFAVGNGRKRKYVNQAFFIDSDIVKTLNNALNSFWYAED